MIKKYRKKPVTIEAIQWNGENLSEIDELAEENPFGTPLKCGEIIDALEAIIKQLS